MVKNVTSALDRRHHR